jgi:hypothetical protein
MEPDSRFEVIAPTDPSFSIALCDPATHPVFKQLFERPQFNVLAEEAATLAEYSLVLTNESSERITGLTVIWNHPHPFLQRRGPSRVIFCTDAYFLEGNSAFAVIPPQAQVLIHPRRTISSALLECENLVHFSMESGFNGLPYIDMLNQATRVTVTFDTILFEGGRVLGPDESRSVDSIKNRKRAATDLVTFVRRAKEDGLDLEDYLQSLYSSERGDGQHQSYDFWLQSFARGLHRGPRAARAFTLMQYANLRELPDFKK